LEEKAEISRKEASYPWAVMEREAEADKTNEKYNANPGTNNGLC